MNNKSDGSTADYYELPKGATELQHLISDRDMNAQMGEIFRATYRYGIVSHSDKLRDIKKIKFYAEAEIERLLKLQEKESDDGKLHSIYDMNFIEDETLEISVGRVTFSLLTHHTWSVELPSVCGGLRIYSNERNCEALRGFGINVHVSSKYSHILVILDE